MMSPKERKIKRLEGGAKPRVLDLFAGCGGLSLGFHTAGFNISGSVELDPFAAQTHATNFFPGVSKRLHQVHALPRDITQVEPENLIAELGSASPESAIDVIVGGPPCQAFARVGRAKLREIAEHPEAFRNDPRGNLYLRYVHCVKKLQPLALVMENVPDVLNYGGHNIPDEICEQLESIGYVCGYTMLNAAYFGVPQMRERMFLIAYAKELAASVAFPAPTHWVDLPRGYEGSRRVALGSAKPSIFPGRSCYFPPSTPAKNLTPAVTASEALGDLPPITAHLNGGMKRGVRRFTEQVSYREDVQPSDYGQLMRHWPGFENEDGVSDHVIRYLPRDYPIFRRMQPGDQYPEAYQHALAMFMDRLGTFAKEGNPVTKGSTEYRRLLAEIVPPYDAKKFPNKWRKMEADKPVRTLLAHIGKDTYSHIHYDSQQARTISVREAARLQSFPDGFVFSGSMNHALRQIGNAVPPLLAFAVAKVVGAALGMKSAEVVYESVA